MDQQMSGCPTSEELSTQQVQAAGETNGDVDVGRNRGPRGVQICARSPGQLTLVEMCAEPQTAHFIDRETEAQQGRVLPLWEIVWEIILLGHPRGESSIREKAAPE